MPTASSLNSRTRTVELELIPLNLEIGILLVLSGLFVGLVNTFAGAASSLTLALYMALGMDANMANGTNRIPVIMQVSAMSLGFKKAGYLDIKTAWRLGIPAVVGAIIGSIFAVKVNPALFEILLGTILIVLLFLLVMNPQKMLRSGTATHRTPSTLTYLWFLGVGLYGGFFHVGVGYFVLSASILSLGYNLMEANALKGFIVLMYIPISLVIFALEGEVAYLYGLVHGMGNLVGAWWATRNSKRIPLSFIRWALIVLILVMVADLFKIIDLTGSLETMFREILGT